MFNSTKFAHYRFKVGKVFFYFKSLMQHSHCYQCKIVMKWDARETLLASHVRKSLWPIQQNWATHQERKPVSHIDIGPWK